MPLLKKKHAEFIPIPPDIPPDAEVYIIKYTGEIFPTYENYLARMSFYKKKIWTCESTGKNNLTFEEALNSELAFRKEVMELFPHAWRTQILSLIHYNSQSVNDLVDVLYEKIKDGPVPGEFVYVGAQLYIVVESFEQPISVAENLSINSVDANKDLDSESIPPAIPQTLEKMVRVRYTDEYAQFYGAHDEFIFQVSKIKRDKHILAKNSLRKFIKEVAVKEVSFGAPFIVKSDIALEYKLPNGPTAEVLELMTRKKSHSTVARDPVDRSKRKRKSTANIFPIEDTDLLKPELNFKRVFPPGEEATERPMPSYDFGNIKKDLVPLMINVWSFVGVFCIPLSISPYTLDDFKNALLFKSYHHTPSILSETFSSLLAISCVQWAKRLASTSSETIPSVLISRTLSSTSIESIEESQDILMPEITAEPEKSQEEEEFDSAYSSLSSEEKAALDQWWKWYPGRWIPAAIKKHGNVSAEQKLKAWQVVLAGVIRDWIPIEALPNKFAILKSLLSPHEVEEEEETSSAIQEENNSQTPQISISEDSVQEPENDESSDDMQLPQYSLRKRKMSLKIEEESENLESERKTRKSIRASVSKQLNSDQLDDSSNSAIAKIPEVKHEIKTKIAFEELCLNSERGFGQMDADDRILILKFLIDNSVSSSPQIHAYVEKCLDKLSELKKEKRDIFKEKKELNDLKEDFKKREREAKATRVFEASDTTDVIAQETNPDDELSSKEENITNSNPKKILKKETLDQDVHSNEKLEDVEENGVYEGNEGNDDIDEMEDEIKNESKLSTPTSSNNGTLSRHDMRRLKLLAEQQKREEEEAKRAEEAERIKKESKEKQKEYRLRQEERKKLEEQEKTLIRREAYLDQQIRICSGSLRIKSIGRDRFLNRYWWLDGSLGAYTPQEIKSLEVSTKGRPRSTNPQGTLDWASGCLFVEEFGLENSLSNWDDEDLDIRKQGNECGIRWGYYNEPIQIDYIHNWLDPRGIRERALQTNLTKIEDLISDGMIKRMEDINNEPGAGRRKGKSQLMLESFIEYVNHY